MAHSASQRLERIRSAIDQYQGRLIAFAVRITRDLESARDVVQDTFVRLCQQDLDAIGDHLPAWLYRVCRNRALDIRRKEGHLEPIDETPEHAAGHSGSDPERLLETADDSSRVLAAVARLPPAQQEVLRLRFQEELSYKEIGAVTGRSVNNVGVMIHTAIRQVRQHLRAEGGRSDG